MSETALQARLDPLGIWAAPQETAVAFGIGRAETRAPIRRIPLPSSSGEAQAYLRARAEAVALTHQYLDRAAQELALIGLPGQVSFSVTDELLTQKNSLSTTIGELCSPVSYGIKVKSDPEERETQQGWLELVEQVRQAVTRYARVRTDLGSVPIGLTTVTWQGDSQTTWTTGLGPDEMQVHLDAVHVALSSRIEMVRMVSVVAAGVANILLKVAVPGGQLLLLPAVYKFVRDVMQQLFKPPQQTLEG